MMRHRDPNRLADRIIFWVCFALLFIFVVEAAYRLGHRHGVASVKPCPNSATKSLYDLNKRQLRQVIRYEQAKAQ